MVSVDVKHHVYLLIYSRAVRGAEVTDVKAYEPAEVTDIYYTYP